MQHASEYLALVKSALISYGCVTGITIVRDEALAETGLYRYRVTLSDGGLLEMCERFTVFQDEVKVTKYSFHWQDATGKLRKRWDNATHHPEIATFPHHLRDGSETHVVPYPPVMAVDILKIIDETLSAKEKH